MCFIVPAPLTYSPNQLILENTLTLRTIQVLSDLPEMYDAKENKSNPQDEKTKLMVERNQLYVSTYFNVLSMMNQRIPQISQLFRQLAPSYMQKCQEGMDVEGVKTHLRQSPLSQIIPPQNMSQMFQVADQIMAKQKKNIDDAFEKRKAMENKEKEEKAKERAAKLLGETTKTTDESRATTSENEKTLKALAKWKWNDGDKWMDYTEEDNMALEKAYQEDKEVCRLNNR